jgi:hypothetical protein
MLNFPNFGTESKEVYLKLPNKLYNIVVRLSLYGRNIHCVHRKKNLQTYHYRFHSKTVKRPIHVKKNFSIS